jgi:tRNA-2-methylthio-N6-dimethylallyladenosine synthase
VDDVPEPVKGYRTNQIIELQKEISLSKNKELIGTTVEVMLEGHSKKSDLQWMGHSDHNVTVVWPKDNEIRHPGDLVPVLILDASPSTLYGHVPS